MLKRTEDHQLLHHEHDAGGELSTIDLRQRRSEQAPSLRMAFAPAAQGNLAAVEQVPTAAAFSSLCNGVRVTGRLLATLRQDKPRGADVRERMRCNLERPWFPHRISVTSFSNRFCFCPPSQGKGAVVGPVPAAATSFVSAESRGRADMVDIVARGRAR